MKDDRLKSTSVYGLETLISQPKLIWNHITCVQPYPTLENLKALLLKAQTGLKP